MRTRALDMRQLLLTMILPSPGMNIRLRHLWLWFRYLLVIVVVLVAWAAWQRVAAVAAVQDAVQHDWEISFGGPNDIPAYFSESFDAEVQGWFGEHFRGPPDPTNSLPTKQRNRNLIYCERFRSLFRGPVVEIEIYSPEIFCGDLGSALTRFPSLRSFRVLQAGSDRPTEADWTRLCTGLRRLPHLEAIHLAGDWLTDQAIAPLAGHPELHAVAIGEGRLTTECLKTLATIPQLKSVVFEGEFYKSPAWRSPEAQKAVAEGLPGIYVELP